MKKSFSKKLLTLTVASLCAGTMLAPINASAGCNTVAYFPAKNGITVAARTGPGFPRSQLEASTASDSFSGLGAPFNVTLNPNGTLEIDAIGKFSRKYNSSGWQAGTVHIVFTPKAGQSFSRACDAHKITTATARIEIKKSGSLISTGVNDGPGRYIARSPG